MSESEAMRGEDWWRCETKHPIPRSKLGRWPLGLCVLFCSGVLVGHAQSQNLTDTLAWMDNTYNPHPYAAMASGRGHYAWYEREAGHDKLKWAESETFSYRGCQMTVNVNQSPYADSARDMYTDYTETFNLGDLNPDSVKIETATHYGDLACDSPLAGGNVCDHGDVVVLTHNESPLITSKSHSIFPRLTGKDHESTSVSKRTEVVFVVDDPAYSQRFSKALRQAIQLCGGKPQSF